MSLNIHKTKQKQRYQTKKKEMKKRDNQDLDLIGDMDKLRAVVSMKY